MKYEARRIIELPCSVEQLNNAAEHAKTEAMNAVLRELREGEHRVLSYVTKIDQVERLGFVGERPQFVISATVAGRNAHTRTVVVPKIIER